MQKIVRSLDGSFEAEVSYLQPACHREIEQLRSISKAIPRGAGLSYAPLSMGQGSCSVNMTRFNRILAFDADANLIKVEAGASLQKLRTFLEPKGFYLPVQPGHPQITVGGCIASNVHGKNQFREGLFCDYVMSIDLFHPDRGFISLSAQHEPELFRLTCGGFGLTGWILAATLRVQPLRASHVIVEYQRIKDLHDTFCKFESVQGEADMLYSWHDLSQAQGFSGRGFLVKGRLASHPLTTSSERPFQKILVEDGRAASLCIWNHFSLGLFNQIFFHHHVSWLRREEKSFADFLFPIARRTGYFSSFGVNGFREQQVLIPRNQVDGYFEAFLDLAAKIRPRIVLASCKIFRGDREWLQFSGDGISFTYNLVADERAMQFFEATDALNCSVGAKTNLAKDSRISADVVKSQFPGYEDFRRRVHANDPRRVLVSVLSERIGI